jgi:uncharacterized protein (DUF427 family)
VNGGLASETRGRIRVEHGSKRIRAYLGNDLVVDTIRPLLVWEHRYYPAYYFPSADVRTELLETDGVARSPRLGEGKTFTIRAGEREVPRAALRYDEPQLEELRDTIRLEWDAMDAWFEEDEEVFTHARDPHTRVDILSSSRHVRIEVDGVTIAESTKPTVLFETGLPPRYYLQDSRPHGIAESDGHSHLLSLQGPGGVLDGRSGRADPRRPRLVVPHTVTREPERSRAL